MHRSDSETRLHPNGVFDCLCCFTHVVRKHIVRIYKFHMFSILFKLSLAQHSLGPATACMTPWVRTIRVRQRREKGANGANMDNSGNRRPADVYLPRWRWGGPACLDFAVISGPLRQCRAKIRRGRRYGGVGL